MFLENAWPFVTVRVVWIRPNAKLLRDVIETLIGYQCRVPPRLRRPSPKNNLRIPSVCACSRNDHSLTEIRHFLFQIEIILFNKHISFLNKFYSFLPKTNYLHKFYFKYFNWYYSDARNKIKFKMFRFIMWGLLVKRKKKKKKKYVLKSYNYLEYFVYYKITSTLYFRNSKFNKIKYSHFSFGIFNFISIFQILIYLYHFQFK